ncbi:MAG: type I restriction endonuclease subunit R [Phycisphaerales bacterium]|nr:type I restriction endonuclease subunit R [Phycisphaerales bacterium]
MPADHRERAFETVIEDHLLGHGYHKGDARDHDAVTAPEGFDRESALFPGVFVEFVRASQPETWKTLEKLHAVNTAEVVVNELIKNLDSRGCLDVVRHGFKCYGKQIEAAFFRPSHGLNPDTQRLYGTNRLTVTRQVHFCPDSEQSIDLMIAINGLPIVTAELKNPMSGQTVEDAKRQYMNDRDPRELVFQFKKRSLVHFAVDPDLVFMTTQLKGRETAFLPFNRGDGNGAGNPDNPAGHKTSYLWEEVWQRDSMLDIVARFLHLQTEERRIGGRRIRKERMIFPRYHQLDAVRRMEVHARAKGAGHNYLVQHSAGSGKSNSIGWLAQRLASLHNERDEKVFHSVVVITDRVVLDQQLQETIYQFEHKHGVVQKIDENSTQLAEALKTGVPIIITTLQKFPFVTDKIGDLPERRYAVIVDEAHSSQAGETAAELRGVLAGARIREQARQEAAEQELPDHEEEIIKAMKKRGRQPNLSFFGFTATPKYKTLEMFGQPGPDGKPEPFHLYSMRQAIEEGFILDVLQNYTTYKAYFRLIKSVEDDPHVEKRKAARALARFMTLHPHNIEQKTEVMVEHFWQVTRHKIGGKAKAMVVTASRMAAVRYKQAFDRYIREKGYPIKTLVAFSGTVVDDLESGTTYTEGGMNTGISGKELPEKFATEEYQLLLVAEKFQTGFDQPLLHTMYVDKKLEGVHAVQTLSRLNRTHPGKEDTFVLDFVNDRDEILKAFQPYYEATSVGEQADPQQLYALQAELAAFGVFTADEVEAFCRVFFKPKANQSASDHAQMNAILDPAVSRFKGLRDELRPALPEAEWKQAKEEAQETFRAKLYAFRSLYAFLSQVIPYQDSDLEKLYAYARFLIAKLPRRGTGPRYHFEDEVALKFYRLQKISEGAIPLQPGAGGEIKGPTALGTGLPRDEEIELSSLIELLNERFGTDFKPADQLFLDSVREDALADETLRQAARANTLDNFKYVFSKALEGLFIDRMEQNEEIFARFMGDKDFQRLVEEHLRRQVYERVRADDDQPGRLEVGASP